MTQEQDNRPSEAAALLPCPHCGSLKVRAIEYAGHHEEYPQWHAGCTSCDAGVDAVSKSEAVRKWNTRAHPFPAPTSEPKPWHETDAVRDLSRIIPDMAGKIAEARTLYGHSFPKGRDIFAPLECSITELRVLHHELIDARPAPTSDEAAVAAAARAVTHFVAREDEDAQDISAVQYISNRSDLIAHAAVTAYNQARPVEGLLREAMDALDYLPMRNTRTRQAADNIRNALANRASSAPTTPPVEGLAPIIQRAIENTPYPFRFWAKDREPEEWEMDEVETLREFYEATWVGNNADRLFAAVTKSVVDALAAIAAYRLAQPVEGLVEALRECRRAISHGADEPRRNVREIVDTALANWTAGGVHEDR